MKLNKLSIVMYHYVRDLKNSAYPRIKGLNISSFRRQLDFLQANYSFISLVELTACIKESKPLPDSACWLTFDDGYRDHYEYVFPELLTRGLKGAFFPSAKAVAERQILDVNKIHFILASVSNTNVIVEELRFLFLENGLTHTIGKSFDDLWIELAQSNRFDSSEIIFVKPLLQHALPEVWRARFTDLLFAKYVSVDTRAFADHLYISANELFEMIQAGMYVGSHGYRHLWLGKENQQTQLDEIQASLAFLGGIGAPTDDWVMCYPYGDRNYETLEILRSKGCLASLTTEVGISDLQRHPHLEMPRLDTNDSPQ